MVVHYAVHNPRIDVIDASKTIHAIHQTVSDGDYAGHKMSLDKEFNVHLVWPKSGTHVSAKDWEHGRTTDADFGSYFGGGGGVAFTKRVT